MSVRSLSGYAALVTGANHGIGAATARSLASLGADVAAHFLRLDPTRHDPALPFRYGHARAESADQVVADCLACGVRAIGIEADLSRAESPARLFDDVEAMLGPISILVNNASGWRQDSFVAQFGFTANIVHPPVTDTGWVTDEVRDFLAATGHSRVIAPEEVAEVIGWLCTPQADLVTGNVIRLR